MPTQRLLRDACLDAAVALLQALKDLPREWVRKRRRGVGGGCLEHAVRVWCVAQCEAGKKVWGRRAGRAMPAMSGSMSDDPACGKASCTAGCMLCRAATMLEAAQASARHAQATRTPCACHVGTQRQIGQLSGTGSSGSAPGEPPCLGESPYLGEPPYLGGARETQTSEKHQSNACTGAEENPNERKAPKAMRAKAGRGNPNEQKVAPRKATHGRIQTVSVHGPGYGRLHSM
eukprot:366065-Chlamydomonas_euryale.AAC.1